MASVPHPPPDQPPAPPDQPWPRDIAPVTSCWWCLTHRVSVSGEQWQVTPLADYTTLTSAILNSYRRLELSGFMNSKQAHSWSLNAAHQERSLRQIMFIFFKGLTFRFKLWHMFCFDQHFFFHGVLSDCILESVNRCRARLRPDICRWKHVKKNRYCVLVEHNKESHYSTILIPNSKMAA